MYNYVINSHKAPSSTASQIAYQESELSLARRRVKRLEQQIAIMNERQAVLAKMLASRMEHERMNELVVELGERVRLEDMWPKDLHVVTQDQPNASADYEPFYFRRVYRAVLLKSFAEQPKPVVQVPVGRKLILPGKP